MKKIIAALLLLLLLIPSAFAGKIKYLQTATPQPFSEEEALMKIYFFEVRAQDCALVICGDETMLIDAGLYESGPVIAEYLRYLGIERINYAVNTHPHDDHIDGFVSLMDEITIDKLYVCFPLDANEHMEAAVKKAEECGVEVVSFNDQSDLSFGGNAIRLYQDKETDNMNHCSMVMHISYGECSALFTADIGRYVHERLAESWGPALKTDILKLPHHGLYTPKKIMVTTADPEICIITNGHNSDTDEAVRYVESWDYDILFTPHGTLECMTNGEYWTMKRY